VAALIVEGALHRRNNKSRGEGEVPLTSHAAWEVKGGGGGGRAWGDGRGGPLRYTEGREGGGGRYGCVVRVVPESRLRSSRASCRRKVCA